MGGDGVELVLEKGLLLRGGVEGFEVAYRLINHGKGTVAGRLCSEWNLNLLSGNGPDRYYEGLADARELSSRGVAEGVRAFRVVDGWRGVAAEATLDRDCAVLFHPVETASLSEAGAEKIHQGVCLRVLFPVSLPPGESGQFSLYWTFISVA